MGEFFSLDGPFVRFGNMLADVLILSLLWFAISLFTLNICKGIATTAVFYVMTKKITNRDGYLLKDFFSSFKMNFIQATLSWLVVFIVIRTLIINVTFLSSLSAASDPIKFLLPFEVFFLIEAFMIAIYIFPLISRFQVKFFQGFKSAFLMANRHFFTTISCAGTILVLRIITHVIPFLYFFQIGIYALVASYFLMKVFGKYAPELVAEQNYGEAIEKNLVNSENAENSDEIKQIGEVIPKDVVSTGVSSEEITNSETNQVKMAGNEFEDKN